MDEANVLIAAPIVAGMVEGAKQAGIIPDTMAGPAALVFAFGVVALLMPDPVSREAALTSIITGLTAAGFYSQAKYYADRIHKDPTEMPDLP